jgi:PKD repeat protein
VAVRELGTPSEHVDFASRMTVVQVGTDASVDDHATAVIGQVASDGVNFPAATGVAPAASIYVYAAPSPNDLNDPFDISDMASAASTYGARISNHSYGPVDTSDIGDYTTDSASLDGVLSANNIMGAFAGDENAPPFFKQTDFFVGAKNTICVTATADMARAGPPPVAGIASYSQGGPMNDGRIKPDLAAYGGDGTSQGVTLDQGVNNTKVDSGTSFATPVVTGVMALASQAYQSITGKQPDAALLKALLCNSAGNPDPTPDATYGFGIVDANATIETINLYQSASATPFFEGSMINGGDETFTINNADTTPLKVTLCWLDPPGNPAAASAIINNLDLTVTGPDSSINYPYMLDPNNPSAAATNTGPNRVDPIAQVIIPSPAVGAWTVTVSGYSIPQGPQAFAVCANKASSQASSSLTAKIQASPVSGLAPLTVSFSAASSTGTIVSYTWNFGDGTATSNLVSPQHQFTQIGTYLVNLTVTDANGNTSTATVTINATTETLTAFALNAQAVLNFPEPGKDKLLFTVVVPALVITPQEVRNAIKDRIFAGKTFVVTVGNKQFPAITVDYTGNFLTTAFTLKENLAKGELTVEINTSDLEGIFKALNITASPGSGSVQLPVSIISGNASYSTVFQMLYKNPRGITATAKAGKK